MLTHDNILKNLAMIVDFFGADAATRNVSWLPFHHDMGLLGGLLATVFCGGHTTLLSPTSFLQQPVRWLRAITRARQRTAAARISPTTCAPPFAMNSSTVSTCVRGASRTMAPSRSTLPRWIALRPASSPAAFPAAFLPCYGLAEASLFVTGRRVCGRRSSERGQVPRPPVTARTILFRRESPAARLWQDRGSSSSIPKPAEALRTRWEKCGSPGRRSPAAIGIAPRKRETLLRPGWRTTRQARTTCARAIWDSCRVENCS